MFYMCSCRLVVSVPKHGNLSVTIIITTQTYTIQPSSYTTAHLTGQDKKQFSKELSIRSKDVRTVTFDVLPLEEGTEVIEGINKLSL